MRIIQELSDQIEDEIAASQNYADSAIRLKEDRPELSKTYYNLATEELGHVDALHAQALKLIAEYKDRTGEPPTGMKAIYDWLHKKHVDAVTCAKVTLASYK